MKKQPGRNKIVALLFLSIAFIGALFLLPPISQDPHYHLFAGDNMRFGIPNCMNVISNIPFVVIGFLGIIKIINRSSILYPKAALLVFFIGIVLTGAGSAYYHWHPDNHTLLWDRLPMTIAFMSLLSAIVSLHIGDQLGKNFLFPLLLIGAGTVVYWYITEQNGIGDLRPYILVQFYPMLFIPLIIFLYPVKGAAGKLLLPMIGFYAVAKYFEYCDEEFYLLTRAVSGHTLKHLFAAAATLPIVSLERIYQPDLSTQ